MCIFEAETETRKMVETEIETETESLADLCNLFWLELTSTGNFLLVSLSVGWLIGQYVHRKMEIQEINNSLNIKIIIGVVEIRNFTLLRQKILR